MRGISTDSMNPYGRPTARSLKLLKVDGVRMVAFNEPMWFTCYRELEAANLGVANVYTGQSFKPGLPMFEQSQNYGRLVHPVMHIICNEHNDPTMDACWPPGGPDAFVEVYNEIASGIRSVDPSAYLVSGGLFSMIDPRPYLRSVLPRLNPKPNAIGYHPYREGYETSTPEGYEGVATLFPSLTAEFGLPIVADEWNDSDPAGIKRFERILERTTAHSMYFAYHDLMVANHGVIDALGRRKPQWYALKSALTR